MCKIYEFENGTNLPAWEPKHQLDHCLHIEFLEWSHSYEDKQLMSTESDQPDHYLAGKNNIMMHKSSFSIIALDTPILKWRSNWFIP